MIIPLTALTLCPAPILMPPLAVMTPTESTLVTSPYDKVPPTDTSPLKDPLVPETLPVTLPVTIPVTFPVTLPVRLPLKLVDVVTPVTTTPSGNVGAPLKLFTLKPDINLCF